jgi:hypothetical protein
MAPRRVSWSAVTGSLPTQGDWVTYGGLPWSNGVFEEKNDAPALKMELTAAGQYYRLFLPDSLRSQAAVEIDFTFAGVSSILTLSPLTLWLPGETAAVYHGLINPRTSVALVANNNGAPISHLLGATQHVRYQLRLERRAGEAKSFLNGVEKLTHGTLTPNAKRTTQLSNFPMDAPNDCCLLLTHPGIGATQTVWIHGLLWEELH